MQQSPSAQSNWQNVLNSVSSTLGLSTSALQQQLQSGQSLNSIAQTQGVSQQTLAQSISTALTQNGSTASGSQLQQLTTNIANRTPGAGGHHHRHGGASSSTQQSSASTLLAALDGSSSSSTTNPLSADATQVTSGLDTFA
ncbi:MAG: hypothetical protein ACLP8S_29790 [Solirubrobacteraceae bacterium]